MGSAEAQRLLDLGLSLMPSEWCGLDRGDASGIYLPDGRMKFVSNEPRRCLPCAANALLAPCGWVSGICAYLGDAEQRTEGNRLCLQPFK